jgi:hypothetical protein
MSPPYKETIMSHARFSHVGTPGRSFPAETVLRWTKLLDAVDTAAKELFVCTAAIGDTWHARRCHDCGTAVGEPVMSLVRVA